MKNQKLYNLLKVRDINWFNSAVNISLKGKYVYIENPKVASSTIKAKLNRNELIGLRGVSVGPHPDVLRSPFVKPYQLPTDMLAEILFGDEFFIFTFVRNPYDRVLSAYLDKIVGGEGEKGQIDNQWKKQNGASKEEYSFDEFLEAIVSIPDNLRDKHWRTQSALTMVNHLNYSYIGKMERIESDMSKIQSMSLIDFSDTKEYSPHKTNSSKKYEQYFKSKDMMEIVDSVYKADFLSFKYKNGGKEL